MAKGEITQEEVRKTANTVAFSRLSQIAPFVVLCIYPIWFLWQPLTSNIGTQIGKGTSDLNGGILYAEILSRMPTLFSPNLLTNSPNGETFWTALTIPQTLLNVLLWGASHVLPATNAVAVVSAVGWILTGVSVYLLAREVGANRLPAVAAGVIGESLPWLQLKAGSHIAYLFAGLVLFAWIFAIRFAKKSELTRLIAVLVTLAVTALTDTYLFYFSTLGVIVITLIATNSKSVRIWLATSVTVIVLVRLVFSEQLIRLENGLLNALQRSAESGQRTIQVATHSEISAWTSSLFDYVRPWSAHLAFPQDWNRAIEGDFAQDFAVYAGVICLVLGMIGIWFGLRSPERRYVFGLLGLAVVLVLVSVNFGDFSNSASGAGFADLVSPFMPGARVFSRAGILAELLIVVFMSLCLTRCFRFASRRAWSWAACLVLTFLVLLDLNPAGGRYILFEKQKYMEFASTIRSTSDPRVAIFPSKGRWYLDASYLGVPVVNGLRSNARISGIESAAQAGALRLWCAVRSESVSHVISPVGGELKAWDQAPGLETLTEPYFSLEGVTTVTGSYSNYQIKLGLFAVNPAKSQHSVEDCFSASGQQAP